MVTEIELYQDNVPHGDVVLKYGDWNSSQDDIEVTASVGNTLYVSSISFAIDDSAAITAGSISIAGGNFSLSITDLNMLFMYASSMSVKRITFNGSDYVTMGEILFYPPVQITEGDSFTISANGLSLTTGAVGPFFAIRGWEDTIT